MLRRERLPVFFKAGLCFLAVFLAQPAGARSPAQPIVHSETVYAGLSKVQVDYAEGPLDLPYSAITKRIQEAVTAVLVYYGQFPVPRARILIVPITGDDLHGTTWGDESGAPAFLRIEIGRSVTHRQLDSDWVITHELVHTALPSLPDDQHWLEEGLASYVEPIARVQAGEMPAEKIWADMAQGMVHGEPQAGDRGLDRTHTWGRTYWGGALFCLVADIEILRQTQNRRGLQDALRAIVRSGGAIDKEWPIGKVLATGDAATGTHVLEQMYDRWSGTAVPVDLPQLWLRLGVVSAGGRVTFDAAAPDAALRAAITTRRP